MRLLPPSLVELPTTTYSLDKPYAQDFVKRCALSFRGNDRYKNEKL